jgi:hypothetical protein
MRRIKNKSNKQQVPEKTLSIMKNSFINSSNAYYMFWPDCPSSGNIQYKIYRRLVATVHLGNRNELSLITLKVGFHEDSRFLYNLCSPIHILAK